MNTTIFFLVLSTLLQVVVPQALLNSLKPIVELVSGDTRIFSGESVRLKCTVPDVHNFTWSYLWFRGSEQLPSTEEHLVLWNAHITESGKFYCQGVRNSLVGKQHTLQSEPRGITVDGGWAILQGPRHASLVGDVMEFTCRVRGTRKVNEVILYKDGVEVTRGPNTHLYVANASLEDQGMYSCRASWDKNMLTHSVISADTPVQVLEILSQPVLEIDGETLNSFGLLILICHHQYNARAPAPPVYYYFYKDNKRLGMASSENNTRVKRAPGEYSCMTNVLKLGLTKKSEPRRFEQEPGIPRRPSGP